MGIAAKQERWCAATGSFWDNRVSGIFADNPWEADGYRLKMAKRDDDDDEEFDEEDEEYEDEEEEDFDELEDDDLDEADDDLDEFEDDDTEKMAWTGPAVERSAP
ncbi:MAG: hypothetical protein V2A79_11115 [Planctomycetota bacterium]